MKKLMILFQAFGRNGIFAKVPHILRMVKAAKKGEYKMDTKSVLIPALAIIYILSPLDIIPDWIPVIGALDDLGLLALTIPFIVKEVDKFLAWEEEQKELNDFLASKDDQKFKNTSTKVIDAEIVE